MEVVCPVWDRRGARRGSGEGAQRSWGSMMEVHVSVVFQSLDHVLLCVTPKRTGGQLIRERLQWNSNVDNAGP